MCLKNVTCLYILKRSPTIGASATSQPHRSPGGKSVTNTNLLHLPEGPLAHLCGKQVSTLPRAASEQLGVKRCFTACFPFQKNPLRGPQLAHSPMGNIITSMEQIIIDPPVKPSFHQKNKEFLNIPITSMERTPDTETGATENVTLSREILTFPGHCPMNHTSATLGQPHTSCGFPKASPSIFSMFLIMATF